LSTLVNRSFSMSVRPILRVLKQQTPGSHKEALSLALDWDVARDGSPPQKVRAASSTDPMADNSAELATLKKLYSDPRVLVTTVYIQSIKTKTPQVVFLDDDEVDDDRSSSTSSSRRADPTVGDVKARFRRTLALLSNEAIKETAELEDADLAAARSMATSSISSRKAIVLRWQGNELDDHKTLRECRVPDNATLHAAFRKRTAAELAELHLRPAVPMELDGFAYNQQHIYVVDQEGTLVEAVVTGATLVGELKAQCQHAPEVGYYFSAHFTSTIGTPLGDDRTLGSYGVLEGDALFAVTVVDGEEDD